MSRIIAVLSLLFCVPALAATDEGELHMKYTSIGGQGDATVHFSKLGSRTDLHIDMQGQKHIMSTLIKADNKEIVYQINDDSRSYSEINIAQKTAQDTTKYTVKKLGSEAVAGHKCEHVMVTSERGGESEVWLNKALYDEAKQLQLGMGREQSNGVMKAMKEAGVLGVPLKLVSRNGSMVVMSMELVSLDRKPQADALFEIPSGYKKTQAGFGALTPEMRKKVMEQMKNLTPEQREQMKNAMGGQDTDQAAGDNQ